MQASELMQDAGPFYRRQVERCSELGIDAGALPVSHLAVRTRTWREYLVLRDEFEERSVANLENVWNGRPISKLLLADPLPFSESASVELVELIPPFHQRVHRMGLEHVGFVVGAELDDFSRRHRAVLTGQQFQGSANEPVLHPVRRLHPREVPSAVAQGCLRARRSRLRRFSARRLASSRRARRSIRSRLTVPAVPIDLQGRAALVTGASRGIGAEVPGPPARAIARGPQALVGAGRSARVRGRRIVQHTQL